MPKLPSVINKIKEVSLIVMVALLGFFVVPAMASERYTDNSDGTVTDTHTGWMWAAKDNGYDINWLSAKAYCENYTGGGYSDWRLPTQDELAGLYDENILNKGGYHISYLINLTMCCPWASETRGSEAAGFYFYRGFRLWGHQSYSGDFRALPVHRGK